MNDWNKHFVEEPKVIENKAQVHIPRTLVPVNKIETCRRLIDDGQCLTVLQIAAENLSYSPNLLSCDHQMFDTTKEELWDADMMKTQP